MTAIHRTDLGSRMYAINSALFSAAEARGHAIRHGKDDPNNKWLAINGERINWWLYERDTRRKVPLTEKERQDPFYSLEGRRGWKQVLEPSGLLVLSIKADFGGDRRLDEHPKRQFESRIDKILDRFEKTATETAQRRADHDERQRRVLERQTRSDDRSRREDVEEGLRRTLEELAGDWAEANRLRDFVDAVAKQNARIPDPSGKTAPWLAWARSHVNELDPLVGGIGSFLKRLYPPKVSEYEMNFGVPEDEDR